MSGIQQLLLGGAQVVSDPNFEYTTLLLPGNGTNGAQNNTFLDSSTNAFSITRNGNTTQGTFSPFSQTGWGNYFDGTGDWISAPSNAVFDFSGDFTIELWFYATTVSPTYQGFCGRRANAASFGPFSMGLNGASVLFSLSTSGSSWALNSTGGTVTANSWNHVAFVRSGTACTAYLNGTSIITGTVSGALASSSQNLAIGTFANDGTDAFNGYISNFRIVKGTAVYTANFTPSTTPLTAISGTSLLTCQSNRFVDNSSNAFAITRNGDVSVQAFSPFNPTAAWSAATNGGSGYFDGSGDYLQNTSVTNQFDVGSAFTLELWVYVTTYQDAGWINVSGSTVNWSTTTGLYWSLYQTGGTLYWQTGNGSGGAISMITATSPSAGAWHHVAIGYNGTTTRMWIDGTSVGTSTSSYFKPSGTDRFQIGGFTGGSPVYQGYMSNVRFVKGTDVYGVGNSTITVPTAPLTAITNTSLLTNFTNAGIYDATSKNDLETVGNAQISTTQSKFGGSSMLFDGTGDWLRTPTSPNLNMGTGDLTIEGWFYLTATVAVDYRMIVSDATNGNNYVAIRGGGTGGQLEVNVSGTSFRFNLNNSVTINTWFHLAVTRSGTTWYGFINGTSLGSTTNSGSFNIGNGGMFVGRFGGATAYEWPGYMDDLRITKGVARYTANFTAPTAAFPLL